ncbi:hypothetical protein N184_12495 [Sinorhizobium sp. GL28]|nr:hypothetical protein N184_12495 [Sinorhizobium sp. GL28]
MSQTSRLMAVRLDASLIVAGLIIAFPFEAAAI